MTHASCIIDGVRYDHLAIVERQGCASCLCVDGHIGFCTGACPSDAGSLPQLPLPDCGAGKRLQESCVECGIADGCAAFEFKCYPTGPNCTDPGHACGTGETCFTDVCIEVPLCG